MDRPACRKTLAAALGKGRVVLDTVFWIYLFEDDPRHGALCQEIAGMAAAGQFQAAVTPITVAELLVKPVARRRPDIADRYRGILESLDFVVRVPITFETGCLAGALRAKYGLPLPGMIQVAYALAEWDSVLLTNDRALRRVTEARIVLLDELRA